MSKMRKKGVRMKQVYVGVVLLALHGGMLCAWGSESTSRVERKQKMNFFGSVETKEGNVFEIENITVDGNYRQIPVYEKPHPSEKQKRAVEYAIDEQLAANEILLKRDPSCELAVTYLDLNEIREIQAATCDKYVWVYRRDRSHRRRDYIAIVVIPRDESDDKVSYIIERKTKVYCHGIKNSGPEEMQIPICNIKKLSISGYCMRDDSGKCPVVQKDPASNKKKKSAQKGDSSSLQE